MKERKLRQRITVNQKISEKDEVETQVSSADSGGSEASSFFYAHKKCKISQVGKTRPERYFEQSANGKIYTCETSLYGVNNSFF